MYGHCDNDQFKITHNNKNRIIGTAVTIMQRKDCHLLHIFVDADACPPRGSALYAISVCQLAGFHSGFLQTSGHPLALAFV